ncbi:MAG: membrane protein insertion efficiency factor YidD [Betaproteobacteria bacterium]|nr:MAG: membrane protein insertion efficiency factor YidD [Betaproteobacteria bacterium]
MSKIALWLLAAYRYAISPMIGPACRFYPSCSQYAQEAIERYGFPRGVWLSIRRILRCNPWHCGGHDPVP